MEASSTLRAARQRAGLTQAELAARAGTSQATLSQYETAAKQPTVETFTRLLLAAGARVELDPAPIPPVRVAGRGVLEQRGRVLEQVLELAAALPSRRSPELRFPPLTAAR